MVAAPAVKQHRFLWTAVFLAAACMNGLGVLAKKLGAPGMMGDAIQIAAIVLFVPAAVMLFRYGRYVSAATLPRGKLVTLVGLAALFLALTCANIFLPARH